MGAAKLSLALLGLMLACSEAWAGMMPSVRPNPDVYTSSKPVALGGGGGGGLTIVQSTQVALASGTDPQITFQSNITAGNAIVCGMTAYQSEFNAPSDGVNTYVFIASRAFDVNAPLYSYYAANVSGGATTVTINMVTDAKDVSVSCHEISGVNASPLDIHTNNGATSNDPNATVTTTANNSLMVGFVSHTSAADPSIAAGTGGTTLVAFTESDVRMPYGALSKPAATAGANSADFDVGASVPWSMILASFKP